MIACAHRCVVSASDDDRFGPLRGPAALEIEHGGQLWFDGVEPVWINALLAEHCVDELVGGVDDEHKIMFEQALQPRAHAVLYPNWIELCADIVDGRVRGRDALDFAHHPLCVVSERARK